MLDSSYDPWLIGEIDKQLQWIDRSYIAAGCVHRTVNGQTRYVFRPNERQDVRAIYMPRQGKLQISWPSAVRSDAKRPNLMLDPGKFTLQNGHASTRQSLQAILDDRFGFGNGAFLESSQSSRSGTSPLGYLQKLVDEYWPLDIDASKRRGVCRGIVQDLVRGVPAQRLLTEQRQRLESRTRRR